MMKLKEDCVLPLLRWKASLGKEQLSVGEDLMRREGTKLKTNLRDKRLSETYKDGYLGSNNDMLHIKLDKIFRTEPVT